MNKGFFKLKSILCLVIILLTPTVVSPIGVTPYLPLNLSPEIERQIERVLILAGKPVMTRPIAIETVLDALSEARKVDEALCIKVKRYLKRYAEHYGMAQLRAEVAADTADSAQVLPNQHGKRSDSSWQVSADVFYQPNEYALISLGGIAYDGRATPTGSMLSIGIDYAQLDIGYRDHWLSPFTDSSMLISTEAPTMPSITLSNYKPMNILGFSYEIFLAEMSHSDRIKYQDRYTSGNPRLAGLHLQVEPVTGYSIGVSRQSQFGGGERKNDSLSDYIHAFKSATGRDFSVTEDLEFGNHQASITSRILFPGKLPFAVYFEYAGEDYSVMNAYDLGSSSFSLGMDFPSLWDRFDLTYETTEWQDRWYTHHIYRDGLTNDRIVIGNWFGDRRNFNDEAGGMSHMLRLGWLIDDDYLQIIYRTLKNDNYTSVAYKRMHDLGINYSWLWHGQTIGAGIYSGRDVYGEWYARLRASVDFAQRWREDFVGNFSTDLDIKDKTDFFMDMGINFSKFKSTAMNPDGTLRFPNGKNRNAHLGIGALRTVTKHGDIGVRVEWDRIKGHNLYSMRMMDYRYRIGSHFAVSGFFGVGRYETEAPAYGYYLGTGLVLLDIIPKWDFCIDVRRDKEMSRTKVIASENTMPRVFFNSSNITAYVSRHF